MTFDFSGFYPVAADLDLAVEAAEILDITIIAQASEVTTAIQLACRYQRVLDKALGG